jgi:CheY-like chemotaxis protein
MTQDEPHERRRFPRFRAATTATIYADQRCVGVFTIESLSAGGASFVGRIGIAVGAEMTIHVGIPGTYPLGLNVRLVRVDGEPPRARFAVRFHAMSPRAEALLEELAADLAPPPIVPSVLVVESDVRIHEMIWFQLWHLDRGCICVRTPLEAVLVLQEQQSPIKTLVVEVSLPLADGVEILNFAAHHYPQVRRVAMSWIANLARLRDAQRLSGADAMLMKPWKPNELMAALALA